MGESASEQPRRLWGSGANSTTECESRPPRQIDTIVKGGIADQVFICSDFPFKEIRIKIGTKKVTKARKATLNSHWSSMTARYLYHIKEIAQHDAFDLIWWDGAEAVSHVFPKIVRSGVDKKCVTFLRRKQTVGAHQESIHKMYMSKPWAMGWVYKTYHAMQGHCWETKDAQSIY